MAKKKQQEEVQDEKRAVDLGGTSLDEQSLASRQRQMQAAIHALWSERADSLRVSSFSSVDEAIECVIQEVITQTKVPDTKGLRDFLRELIEADPSLRSAIERELV